MHLLSVSLYEFGQFLRILLWVFIPMVIIASLITTYIHYRNKRQQKEQDGQALFSDDHDGHEGPASRTDNTGAYQGMLWIKEKYEQYRETTDKRYERLKEELSRSEKKYLDLLASRSENLRQILPEARTFSPETGDSSTNAQPVGPEDRLASADAGQEKDGPAIETNSLRDLIEEKNSQINFLQSQLEQRIRNFHLIEYQRVEERSQFTELQGRYEEARKSLDVQQQALQEGQQSLEEGRQSLEEVQQSLMEKQQLLDESLQALRESEAAIERLNVQLQQEARKTADLSEKLECNGRLLLRIYKELDRSLNVEKPLPDTGELPEGLADHEDVKRLDGLSDLRHLQINEVAFS